MTSRTRRDVLRASGVATAAAATAVWDTSAHASARERRAGPTFVFVHTTNASASWFTPLVAELALRGVRAFAVELPGHGPGAFYPVAYQAPQDIDALATEPSPARLGLRDYVDHVIRVVRRVRARGPVILVAHGDGGATVNLVANAVPEMIERLGYLAGCCCTNLATLGEYFGTPENAGAVGVPVVTDPATLGVTRINWRTADPESLGAFRAALAQDHSGVAFRAMLNSLQPDEPVSVWGTDARGEPGTWGRVPRTYVRFSADRTLLPALQDRMISEADAATPDNRFSVETVAAPHAGPLHRPEIIAVLESLARMR